MKTLQNQISRTTISGITTIDGTQFNVSYTIENNETPTEVRVSGYFTTKGMTCSVDRVYSQSGEFANIMESVAFIDTSDIDKKISDFIIDLYQE